MFEYHKLIIKNWRARISKNYTSNYRILSIWKVCWKNQTCLQLKRSMNQSLLVHIQFIFFHIDSDSFFNLSCIVQHIDHISVQVYLFIRLHANWNMKIIDSYNVEKFMFKTFVLGLIIIGGLALSYKLLGKRFLIFTLIIFAMVILLVMYMIYSLITILASI